MTNEEDLHLGLLPQHPTGYLQHRASSNPMVWSHVRAGLRGLVFRDQISGKMKAHRSVPGIGPIPHFLPRSRTDCRRQTGIHPFLPVDESHGSLHHPLDIIAVWQGGMSFHGGLIGAGIAGWWFSKRGISPSGHWRTGSPCRPHRPGPWKDRKLHQRRIIWPAFRSSVGHGISRRGTDGPTPFPAPCSSRVFAYA